MKEMKLGKLTIRWLGHASFEIFDKKHVYIDPYMGGGGKADIILITHDHFDHCDEKKINQLRKEDTVIIAPASCAKKIDDVKVIEPDGEINIGDITIKAVDAYNINKSFHPKGFGVGYVIAMDGKKIYHAGDTDKIPEMAELSKENIDAALLPVGGTYTMNLEEAAEAAKMIKPKIIVPMHYGTIEGTSAKPEKLKELLKGTGIEVQVL